MAEKLSATVRTDFGKGAARRIRRNDEVPAVLYAKGDDPIHLTVPGHQTWLILKNNANALVSIRYEGTKSLALVKDVQTHPVRRTIEHVDFVMVTRDQKVAVDVPLTVVGESAPGTIHYLELVTINVTAPVTEIPEVIEVSVEGLGDGAVVRVSDLVLPEDVETDLEPDQPIGMVEIPRIDEADLETPGSEEATEEEAPAEAEADEETEEA